MRTMPSFRNEQRPKTSLRTVRAVTDANLQNELVTRQRVDRLESWAGATHLVIEESQRDLKRVDQQRVLLASSLWSRLKWLVVGAMPEIPQPIKQEISHEETQG